MRRVPLVLALLCFGAYAYFYQAGGWNQNSRFDLTRAIVEHGTSRIDAYHKNTGDKARRDGHFYCDKAPGASWLAVPPVWVAHVVAGPPKGPASLARRVHAATVFAVGVPSAVAVLMLWLLLGELGLGARARTAGAAAWGLASLAFPYATLLYGHQLVASLLVSAFTLLVRARHGKGCKWSLLGAGFLLGAAVAVEYPAALACAVLGVYAIVFLRRRAAWVVAGAVVPAVAVALYHWSAFGGPFTLPYEFSTQKHRHLGFFMGLGAPDPTALWHILVSPYRGIFFAMPWLALALPGAWFLRRRRAELVVCGAIVLLFIWLNASLVDWEGGWAMGARYLVPALPFLAVLASGVFLAPRLRVPVAVAFGALAAYAFALMLIGTSVKPEVPTDVRRPYGAYLLPRFARGELAISTQSIDTAGYPRQGPRQAWNLGHAIGLDGRASLLPLGLFLVGGAGWLAFRLRRG